MTTLRPECACGRKLRAIEAMEVATTISDRTCTCGYRWRVNIRPMAAKPGMKFWEINLYPRGRK